MNDLIPLKTDDRFPVNARDLHFFLGVKMAFAHWVRAHVADKAEGKDFMRYTAQSTGGRPSTGYAITIEFAKHISMQARTEKGEQARQWFIDRENQLAGLEQKAINPANLSKLEILSMALESEQQRIALESRVQQLEPKAEQHDRRMSAEGFFNFRQAAKILGAGPNKLVTALRIRGYLYGTPAMPHESKNRDYFEVKWNLITTGETERQYPQTMVTPKGLQWLERKVTEWGV